MSSDAEHPIQQQTVRHLPWARHGMEQLKRDCGAGESEEVSINRCQPPPHLALVPLISAGLLFLSTFITMIKFICWVPILHYSSHIIPFFLIEVLFKLLESGRSHNLMP